MVFGLSGRCAKDTISLLGALALIDARSGTYCNQFAKQIDYLLARHLRSGLECGQFC